MDVRGLGKRARVFKMVGVLPADANVTLVAHMLSRRLAEVNTTSGTQGVGVTHSMAEEFWSVMFMVVVLILALCMICCVCGIFAQLLGCGSFLTKTLLSGFSAVAKLCTSCCNGTTSKARAPAVVRAAPLQEATVIGPAAATAEELKPLRPSKRAASAAPKAYACCGFPLPCLAWLSVCGCSFVGCAWLGTCWKRTCGGGGQKKTKTGRRALPGGGLSFVQNLLTCWRCCGLLPSCCPAQYAPTLPPGTVRATPKPPVVVQGEPVKEDATSACVGVRPMPALNLA